MSKVGIIGDKDSIMGFLALGIIYITEQASLLAKDFIARYKDNPLPAIIVIPGIGGSMGLGMNEIRESSKRAIGVDILFND